MTTIPSARAERILQAFTDVANRFTVERTTMNDIARHLGISVGTLYQEFAGKKEILLALIEREGRLMLSTLETRLRAKRTAKSRLRILTVEFYELQVEALLMNPAITEFVLRGTAFVRYIHGDFQHARNSLTEQYERCVSKVLEDGVLRGEFVSMDVPITARLLMKNFESFAFEAFAQKRREDVDREVQSMFTIFLRGISNDRH